jgi:hypothetical protein
MLGLPTHVSLLSAETEGGTHAELEEAIPITCGQHCIRRLGCRSPTTALGVSKPNFQNDGLDFRIDRSMRRDECKGARARRFGQDEGVNITVALHKRSLSDRDPEPVHAGGDRLPQIAPDRIHRDAALIELPGRLAMLVAQPPGGRPRLRDEDVRSEKFDFWCDELATVVENQRRPLPALAVGVLALCTVCVREVLVDVAKEKGGYAFPCFLTLKQVVCELVRPVPVFGLGKSLGVAAIGKRFAVLFLITHVLECSHEWLSTRAIARSVDRDEQNPR